MFCKTTVEFNFCQSFVEVVTAKLVCEFSGEKSRILIPSKISFLKVDALHLRVAEILL